VVLPVTTKKCGGRIQLRVKLYQVVIRSLIVRFYVCFFTHECGNVTRSFFYQVGPLDVNYIQNDRLCISIVVGIVIAKMGQGAAAYEEEQPSAPLPPSAPPALESGDQQQPRPLPPSAPPPVPALGRCRAWIQNKHRYCNKPTPGGRHDFCGNHGGGDEERVPCPADPRQ
jgi:hypothetical protein